MNFIRRNILLFCLAILPVLGYSIPDSLIYRIQKVDDGVSLNFNGVNFSFVFKDDNANKWVFKASDDYRYALKATNDDKWLRLPSDFDTEEAEGHFKDIGWFRLHFKIDKDYVGKPFMMRLSHNGASEIFLDGSLVTSYGHVSADPAQEIPEQPGDDFFPLTVNDTLEHVVAVRYSNARYKLYEGKFFVEKVGFSLRFYLFDDMLSIQWMTRLQRYFFVGIALFLFALALVHLMIFLFERSRKFNFYHSLFVGSLSLLFLFPVIVPMISDPLTVFRVNFYSDALIPTFFISALTLLYNLFQKKLNKFYYACLVVYLLALVMKYVFNTGAGFFYTSLFFMMYIGSTVISIKAIRRNFRGAKIVGVGVLGVTIFMILAILSLIVFRDNGLIVAIVFVVCEILSLPLAMSVYLAYDFAAANRTLQSQIIQIEDLSAKALKEEQEKKEILENQNRVLEEQVKQRTAEISHQKEIIEEKNKDITDSINYAKRIQEATLASKEIKYKLFPDAFVLFKPKDIVSGDFYWFAGKGQRRLIAACDCTGHGVPGALMSMIGNNLLNQLVNEKGFTAPDDILNELHEEVRKTLKQGENTETKDGMDVALLSFINDKEFEYAGAQRPLWIIRNGELIETKATKMSIGGQKHDESLRFVKHHVKAEKNDLVYIFSDGFADQFNREDKKLMTRKFKEVLISIRDLGMAEQEAYLNDFIEKWKGDLEQTDDILVIGIRI